MLCTLTTYTNALCFFSVKYSQKWSMWMKPVLGECSKCICVTYIYINTYHMHTIDMHRTRHIDLDLNHPPTKIYHKQTSTNKRWPLWDYVHIICFIISAEYSWKFYESDDFFLLLLFFRMTEANNFSTHQYMYIQMEEYMYHTYIYIYVYSYEKTVNKITNSRSK